MDKFLTSYKLKNWIGEEEECLLPVESLEHPEDLLILPALTDAHVHFRTPGQEYKENWVSASKACLNGGVTTVFDMPNNQPPIVTCKSLEEKKDLIRSQLEEAGIPLEFHLYLGASKGYLSELKKLKGEPKLLKIFMGSSTGTLLLDGEKELEEAFKIASEVGAYIAVHAENEAMIASNQQALNLPQGPEAHSIVRTAEVAAYAVSQAIELAKKYDVPLYLLHLSTQKELDLVRKGKKEGARILAEATPHHLFLSTKAYSTLGTRALVNPPLRDEKERLALWEGIRDGTLDVIGSDHAPHTPEEKILPYGKAPSGVPGVEMTLPLLANEVMQGRLSWERLIALTSGNGRSFFKLKPTRDQVIIDCRAKKKVSLEDLASKAGWSPYEGWELKGWPLFTCIQGSWKPTQHLGYLSHAL